MLTDREEPESGLSRLERCPQLDGETQLERLQQAAECLKTIAHPVRLRMLQMLLRGHFNVGQLADACQIPSHMASEHLRLMQRCQLLTSQREGRCTYYRVAQPHLADLVACIEARFLSPSDCRGGE